MAARSILSFFIKFLAAPFVVISRLAEFFNAWEIRHDIQKCVEAVDSTPSVIPHSFITAIIVAEDHRSQIHPSVDPIAILRATFVRIRYGQRQGASTVEQQFVRVITGRYQKSLSRKVKEQAIAIAVSRRRPKERIAAAYLARAFYGSGCIGISGLNSRCGPNLDSVDLACCRFG